MEQMIKSENALRMAGMKLLIEGWGSKCRTFHSLRKSGSLWLYRVATGLVEE